MLYCRHARNRTGRNTSTGLCVLLVIRSSVHSDTLFVGCIRRKLVSKPWQTKGFTESKMQRKKANMDMCLVFLDQVSCCPFTQQVAEYLQQCCYRCLLVVTLQTVVNLVCMILVSTLATPIDFACRIVVCETCSSDGIVGKDKYTYTRRYMARR